MKEKILGFETKFRMIQAFGCIDGTHIPVASEHSHHYFCYKQFHSRSIQAVYNYKVAFMGVKCKLPGSVHDAKVSTNSSIRKRLGSSDLSTIFQTLSNKEV